MPLSATQIARHAYDAGFRGDDLSTAVAIALAESRGNPSARNQKGEDSVGLMQINRRAHGDRFGTLTDLMDPAKNMQAAYRLWQSTGSFQPWTTYSGATSHGARNSHKNFLSVAKQAAGQIAGGRGRPTATADVASQADARPPGAGLYDDIDPDELWPNILESLQYRIMGSELERDAATLEETPDGVDDGETFDPNEGATGLNAVSLLQEYVRNALGPQTENIPEAYEEFQENAAVGAEAPGVTAAVGMEFVNQAKKFLGTPYLWGGTTARGLDCSGLVQLAFRGLGLGVDLPRVSRDQAKAGIGINTSRRMSTREAMRAFEAEVGDGVRPGDLIAFDAGGPSGTVNHIGIVVGFDNRGTLQMIHAPRTGSTVRVVGVNRSDVLAIRRVT